MNLNVVVVVAAAALSCPFRLLYVRFQASILYVVVVFGTKFFMRNRQPFSLFVPLNIWNFILAAFSIMGNIKLSSEFWTTLFEKGFQSECLPYSLFYSIYISIPI